MIYKITKILGKYFTKMNLLLLLFLLYIPMYIFLLVLIHKE